MAFVFQAEKKTTIGANMQKSPGPGKYNIERSSFNEVISKNNQRNIKIPFNSETLRNDLPKSKKVELESLPGPGAYYVDSTKKEIQKILEKSKEFSNQPLYKLVENNDNIDTRDLLPIGFSTAEKRFKYSQKVEANPGPGSYNLLNDGQSPKNVTSLFNVNIGRNINLNKSPQRNFSLDALSKVSSIPSKVQSYGYEVEKNGNIIPSIDPLKFRKHNGDKLDSVGPGEYNLVNDRVWYQKGTSWSRSKALKLKPPKIEDSIKNYHANLNNSDIVSTQTQSFSQSANQSLEVNTTYKPVKRLNFKEKEILIKNFKQRQIIAKENRVQKEVSQLEQIIQSSETPGPGYYYDPLKHSSFTKNKIAEEYQSFGSSSVRFPGQGLVSNSLTSNVHNEYLGPGSYFRDDTQIENRKMKEALRNLKAKTSPNPLKEEIRIKQNNNNVNQDKFGMCKGKQSSPGPGSYNIKSKTMKLNPNSKAIFGSSSINKFSTFEGNSELSDYIGPGSYLNQENWLKLDKQAINKMMSSPKKFIKPKLIDKALVNNSFTANNDDKFEVPAVGTYNLDRINSIEYNIAKNASKFSLINAPFNSLSKRFNKDAHTKNSTDLGPGYYYKYQKYKPNPYSHGFNSSDNKFGNSSIEGEKNPLGPGQYNKDSYFDWNKKSFNIQFL